MELFHGDPPGKISIGTSSKKANIFLYDEDSFELWYKNHSNIKIGD